MAKVPYNGLALSRYHLERIRQRLQTSTTQERLAAVQGETTRINKIASLSLDHWKTDGHLFDYKDVFEKKLKAMGIGRDMEDAMASTYDGADLPSNGLILQRQVKAKR